jgi:hypothetical protein
MLIQDAGPGTRASAIIYAKGMWSVELDRFEF